MQLNQEKTFSPVTIILDTEEELNTFQQIMMDIALCAGQPVKMGDMAREINNWINEGRP
jgi:hypothetical protein